MSELPKGWAKSQLGQVITLNEKVKGIDDETECGFVPMALMPTAYRGVVTFETKTWEKCKKGFTQFQNNDVLLAKITPCFENGKGGIATGLPNGIGAGSTEYFVLRSLGGLIKPEYLHAFVKSKEFMDDCEVHMGGSVGHKRVPKDYLLKYEIPLAPLNEQIRIANKLDSILAKVDKAQARLDKIPAILKRFRQSVLSAATSGELTKEWRSGRFTWVTKKIDDLADVKGGKRLPKGEELVEDDTGCPYIRAGQLKNGTVISGINARSKQLYLSPEAQAMISRYIVETGDVYITIVGASIGDAGIVPESSDGANLTENAAKITNFKVPLLSEYLAYWLRSEKLQQLIKLEIKSGAQGKLALKRIKDLPVPYTDIVEQQEIVERVHSLFCKAGKIEKQYLDAKARLDRLTQSILAKAFRGELVPQDPNDEPAEQLLERILKEREQVAPKKTTRKRNTKAKTAEKG
ncbi:restriction endonuclease subunit S [Vibrio splendidus]